MEGLVSYISTKAQLEWRFHHHLNEIVMKCVYFVVYFLRKWILKVNGFVEIGGRKKKYSQ